jgi:hypothetical protein
VWRAEDLTGLNALRSQVTFARLGTDRQWAPSFHVTLGAGPARVTFGVTGLKDKNLLLTTLETWQGDKQVSQELYVMMPTPGERFVLELDWSPDGTVTALIRDKAAQQIAGFERHVAKLSGPPTTLSITGSTGEVELRPLQLGTSAP